MTRLVAYIKAYLGKQENFKAMQLQIEMQGPISRTDIVPGSTEPAPISVLFGGFFQKISNQCRGFQSNQEASINRSIHLVSIFEFVEEKRRSKPVFSSVLAKLHLV
jgi:hypothetical protein